MTPKKDPLESALRFLSKAERTRYELRSFLEKLILPADQTEKILNQCADWGYLDDQRVLEREIQKGLASGHGPLRIQTRLVTRGWSESDAEESVGSISTDIFKKSAVASASNMSKAGVTTQRCARKLASLGFTEDHIIEALEHAFASQEP